MWWLLLLHSMGYRVRGLQYLWYMGSVAAVHRLCSPRHVGSSWTRDQTSVPCIGRRILNHWATREVSEQDIDTMYLRLTTYETLLIYNYIYVPNTRYTQ